MNNLDLFQWQFPFEVMKVLSDSNYILKELGRHTKLIVFSIWGYNLPQHMITQKQYEFQQLGSRRRWNFGGQNIREPQKLSNIYENDYKTNPIWLYPQDVTRKS